MRYYSSTAGEMILQSGITASDTTILVNTTAGLPTSYPYTLVLDYGTASEEIVDVTAAATTTLTVTRARDNSVAQAHAFGAKIRHGMTARDLRESREHEALTAAHGTTGAVVGTTDTQTLTNKTLTAPTITGGTTNPTTLQKGGVSVPTISETVALTNKDLSSGTNTFPASLATDAEVSSAVSTHADATTGVHGVGAGAVVGTALTQTLTNKTISGASNTLSAIPQSAVTSLTTDLAALDTRLDSIEAAPTAFTPVAQDGSGTVATSTGGVGYWTKIGKVVHVVGSLTLTQAIVGSASVGLPAAAGTPVFRHLNAGTLWVIGPAAPALTGVATMQTDLLRVTATADTGGFRGASNGDALRFNLTYLVS